MSNSSSSRTGRWLVALAAGTAVIVTTSLAFAWGDGGEKANGPDIHLAVSTTPVERDTKVTTSFAPIVKQVGPSVVNVFSERRVRSLMAPQFGPFFGDPFRWFFGEPDDQRQPRREAPTRKQTSLGSGVVVTEDGYILTNNHVVEGADEIKVSLADDQQQYTAKVVGKDPRTDIAVLKIEAKDLRFATFGDSDTLEVGDVVLAIGNPFGVGQTVTMGIVSAVGRGGMGIEDYEDFIQTDAAINPGNSGGALVDAEGRVVGINTAIVSRTGGNLGVGFAVPVNLAKSVMDRLVKYGRVDRGQLGVMIRDVTPDLAKALGLSQSGGAFVADVVEGSAAEKAGIEEKDVIIEFDGKRVPDSRNLKLMVGETAPGAKVEVKLLRDGKERTFKITLDELADEPRLGATPESGDKDAGALNGVEVTDLNARMRRQLDLPTDLQGALVTNVDPDSASYDAGLREGDILQEIDNQPVKSADDAVEISKGVKHTHVLVKVWRRGVSDYLVVDESKEK